MGGIPKLRRLSLLEYFLGMHGGIPKLERLTLLNLLSSSSLAHLLLPSYITHHNLISEVSTHNKIIFIYCKYGYSSRDTVSQDCQKVFAKKKQA